MTRGVAQEQAELRPVPPGHQLMSTMSSSAVAAPLKDRTPDALALVQLGASVASGLRLYILARRLYPELRIRFGGSPRSSMVAVLHSSATSSMLHLASAMILHLDTIVIGRKLPIRLVTYFAIPASLTTYARALIGGISQTVASRLSALQGAGAEREPIVILPLAAAGAWRVGLRAEERARFREALLARWSFTTLRTSTRHSP